MADPIRITVDYSASGELVIRQALANLDGLRSRVERLSAAGPLSARAMRTIGEDAERVASAYHGKLATAFGAARNESNRLFENVDRFGHRAFYGLLGVTAAVSAGMYGLGKSFIQVNEEFAGLEITVRSALQSVQAARKIRDEVAAITAESPLPFKDLGQTTRNLITMPFSRDKIAAQVSDSTLGDKEGFFRQSIQLVEQMIAFRPDKEAKDAMYAIREAMSGQFRSLIRRFDIPSTALSTSSGKSIKELTNDPEATFKAMKDFFGKIITPESIQELVRQPKFLFQNAIEQMFHIPLLKIGDESFSMVIDQLTSIYNRITKFVQTKFDGYAKSIGGSVKSIFGTVMKAGEGLAETVMSKAGYGQSDFIGESGFERGARMVQDAIASLATNLPKVIEKISSFFERIYPFLASFGKLILKLGGLFLKFVDLSPMGAALAFYFRSAIVGAFLGVGEMLGKKFITSVTTAMAASTVRLNAPDFRDIRGLPGSPSSERRANAQALTLTAAGIGAAGSSTVLDAAAMRAARDRLAASITPTVTQVAKAQATLTSLYATSTTPTMPLSVPLGMRPAEIRRLESYVGAERGSLRAGQILPMPYQTVAPTLSADEAARNLRASQSIGSAQSIQSTSIAAAGNRGFMARSGAFFGSAVGAVGGTIAAAGPGMLAMAVPIALIALATGVYYTHTERVKENAEALAQASIRAGQLFQPKIGGINVSDQVRLETKSAAENIASVVSSYNRSPAGVAGPMAAPTADVSLSTFVPTERLSPEERSRRYSVSPPSDPRNSAGRALQIQSQSVSGLAPHVIEAREKASARDQINLQKWMDSGRNPDEAPPLQMFQNFDRKKANDRNAYPDALINEMIEALANNRKTYREALARIDKKLREQLPPENFRFPESPIAPGYERRLEDFSARFAGLQGPTGQSKHFGDRGNKKLDPANFIEGTTLNVEQLITGMRPSDNSALSDAYEALQKQVKQSLAPFHEAEEGLARIAKDQAKTFRLYTEATNKIRDEEFQKRFGVGMEGHEAEFKALMAEWDTPGAEGDAFRKLPQSIAAKARIEKRQEYLRNYAKEGGGLMEKLNDANFSSRAESSIQGLNQFSLGISLIPNNLKAETPTMREGNLRSVSNMGKLLNESMPGAQLDEVKLRSLYADALINPDVFGEEVENEAVRSAKALASLYRYISETVSKNLSAFSEAADNAEERFKVYLLSSPSLDAPKSGLEATAEEMTKWSDEVGSGLLKDARKFRGVEKNTREATTRYSGQALFHDEEEAFKVARRTAKVRNLEMGQAREELPKFLGQLTTLAPGPAGEHAIAELKNALSNLNFDGLLEQMKDLKSAEVFLKDASGPDHFSVMAEKHRMINRLLPAYISTQEKELVFFRTPGKEQPQAAKKAEANIQKALEEQEKYLATTISYFTQGMVKEIEGVSAGIGESFLRSGFASQLGFISDKLPGIDFSPLDGKLTASIKDQTLPAELGQQAEESSRFAKVQLFGALADTLTNEVARLKTVMESSTPNGPALAEVVSQLEIARRLQGDFSSEFLKRTNDLQRVFLTEQLLRADQTKKTAQGALQSGLEASLNVRPSQIGQFQLQDLEKSVREAGLEGQIDLKNFLKDSTGPENIAVLLEKQKGLEAVFLKLADSFETMAKAAEKAAKPLIPAGYSDDGGGWGTSYATGESMQFLPDTSERDRLRGLSRGFSGKAEENKRSQEDVQGTGMFSSFNQGFRGVTEQFRAASANFKSIGADIAQSLQTNLGSAFGDFIMGTKSAKEAFADFGKSILNEVARIFANKAAAQLIGFATQAVMGMFSAPQVNDSGGYFSSGTYTTKAEGGPIRGGSGVRDDVPALLMGGEFVMRRSAVDKYGERFMEQLNSGKLVQRAEGGMVPYPSSSSTVAPAYTPSGYQTAQASSSYGDSNVSIVINENGKVEESGKGPKEGPFGDNKEFGRMLKSAILEVMTTQRRPGGMWRNA